MRIGIVTPAFNVAPFIAETIGSVLCQTHQDWRMVVVDDGSTDGTASVVRGFDDPRLRLIGQPNAGVSAARNRGAAGLDCDAMLFLDGDDWLEPFALAVLADTLRAAPDAAAVVGTYERGGRVQAPPSGDLRERLLVRNLFANGGHVLIRRTAVQPFREDLRYGEDWEFWARIALSGGLFIPAWSGSTIMRGRPAPLLHVRERPGGAYLRMAIDPSSFVACVDAIHANPALPGLFSAVQRSALRRLSDAEVEWTIGRELIRHRRYRTGMAHLARSVAQAPTSRRIALLAAIALLPPRLRGPLYPYPAPGP